MKPDQDSYDDSSLYNFTSDSGNSRTCAICFKPFSFRRGKHQCKICNRLVCKKDSQKKELKDSLEATRICDDCDQGIIKQEIRQAIDSELAKLNQDLALSKKQNERLVREQINKNSELNRLEQLLTTTEKEFEDREQYIKQELNREQTNNENLKKETEKVRQDFEDSSRTKEKLNSKCTDSERELANLKKQTTELRERKIELTTQLELMKNKLETVLSIEQVTNHLCATCNTKTKGVLSTRTEGRTVLDSSNKNILDVLEVMNKQTGEQDCEVF